MKNVKSTVILILLTVIISTLSTYFWQRSINEKTIKKLKNEIDIIKKETALNNKSNVITKNPQNEAQELSIKNQITPPNLDKKPIDIDKNAELSKIKYTLPEGWEAKIRPNPKDLFISNKKYGGFIAVQVYPYNNQEGRRTTYCKISQKCTKYTQFIPTQIGNITGYEVTGIDNSGGGVEYFGAKGDKFYILSTYQPPLSKESEFYNQFNQVLNSLVF